MFDPILVDKSISDYETNLQKRELGEPVMELPLPETRRPEDSFVPEELTAYAPSTEVPGLSNLHQEIERYMTLKQPETPTTVTVPSEAVEPLPLPETRSESPVKPPVPLKIEETIPISVESTIPISVASSAPMPVKSPEKVGPAPKLPLPSTAGHVNPGSLGGMPTSRGVSSGPPRMPSMGNVAIERVSTPSQPLFQVETIGGMDVIHSGARATPRLPMPDTRSVRKELKATHSTDDPYGVLHDGQQQLDEFSAYSHLNMEMLQSMTDNQRKERDFRHSQLHLMRLMGADLAEDNRRISSIEGAFEIGRESLGDANI